MTDFYMPVSIHTFLRAARLTSPSKMWQKSEDEVPSKRYERMPIVPLPPPAELTTTLSKALLQRRSIDTKSEQILNTAELSTLLGNALHANTIGLRPYPSGGARYPVEFYLVGTFAPLETARVFHYRPDLHHLENLWQAPETALRNLYKYVSPHTPKAFIILTCYFPRTTQKYGDFGYLPAILECGHAAQNILLVGAAQGFNLRPRAGFTDEDIFALLNIDPQHEQAAYVITLS